MTGNKIVIYLTIGAFIVSTVAWIYNHEDSQASAASVTVLRAELAVINQKHEAYKKENRLQRISDQNRARAIDLDERIWVIEQRFLNQPMPMTTKETLYRLKKELKELRSK